MCTPAFEHTHVLIGQEHVSHALIGQELGHLATCFFLGELLGNSVPQRTVFIIEVTGRFL